MARYGVRSIDYWDIDEESDDVEAFETFAVIQLIVCASSFRL